RYLPAVYGQEPVSADFTDRFLALYDTTLRSIERQLDTQARLFDPLSAPAERPGGASTDFLTWLASWLGLPFDRQRPEGKAPHLPQAHRRALSGARHALRPVADVARVPRHG